MQYNLYIDDNKQHKSNEYLVDFFFSRRRRRWHR